MQLETLSEHLCFDGTQGFYRHDSKTIGLPMRFSVYLPPQAKARAVPAIFFLAGLTANEESFMIKAGAQRVAAELGLALISPDTSPRQTGIPGEDKDWEVGSGASFYLNATQAPWSKYFQMEDYIVGELRELILKHFPILPDRLGICGHSMGGHGALVLALRHPGRYRSLSAFAPISAPLHSPWGVKAFSTFLGEDRELWKKYDACELMRVRQNPFPQGILIDQGLGDKFLHQQLFPERFEAACQAAAQALEMRRHEGYDHNYFFISTFIADHLAFHHARLK